MFVVLTLLALEFDAVDEAAVVIEPDMAVPVTLPVAVPKDVGGACEACA